MTATETNHSAAVKRPRFGFRHVMVVILFFSYAATYFSRGIISVAVVSMTSQRSSNPDIPVYNWTETQKNAVISSYYAGLVISSTAAGEIIRLCGAPVLLYSSFVIHAVASAVAPLVASNGNWLLLSFSRVVVGLMHGFLDPLTFMISSKWFPRNERNFLLSIVFSGATPGIALGAQIAGLLAMGSMGWPSIFYVAAVPLLLFCLIWKVLGFWTPGECKYIKLEERLYIEEDLATVKEEKKGGKIPWKGILTSPAVYAVIAAELGQGMLIATLSNEMTLFIDDIHEVSVSLNGLITSIPSYLGLVVLNVAGAITDLMLSKKLITIQMVRRIASIIALGGNGVLILALGWLGSSLTATVIILFASTVLLSFAYVGYLMNPIDLSPNYSQSIVGICRAVENVASFTTPLVFSYFLTEAHSIANWRTCFIVVTIPIFICNVIFVIFGRAEPQPWDKRNEEETNTSGNPQAIE